MIPTQIRLVSLTKKIACSIITNLLILALLSLPSVPATDDSHLSTLSDPPPSYTTYPEDDRDRVVSPYLNSSSNSSRESLPPSPGPKTPPDEDSSARSTLGGKPVYIDFINPSDIKMKHDEIRIHDECERTWGWARGISW